MRRVMGPVKAQAIIRRLRASLSFFYIIIFFFNLLLLCFFLFLDKIAKVLIAFFKSATPIFAGR